MGILIRSCIHPDIQAGSARFSFLSGDDDHPVGALGSIDGGSICIFQHADTFNIGRVDAVQRAESTIRNSGIQSPKVIHIRSVKAVVLRSERNTVYDEQGLVKW